MSRFRFAIVGCGVIHGTHVEAIKALPDDAELVAVCDEVPELAQKVAEKNEVAAFTDLEEMCKNAEFDVLCVCTPSGLHAKHGVIGAQHGKHIICEKPIDVSLAAADALIEACDKNGVKLVVISQHRYSRGMRLLKSYLDEGRLGTLVYAESVTKWFRSQEYYDSGGWRGTWELDGGGALMNQGVHYVDQLRWIMGPVKTISANMATRAHERIEVEDIVSATIEFQSGAVGTLLASTAMYPGYRQALEVYGTGGTVIVENSKVRHAQFRYGDEEVRGINVKAKSPEIKDFEVQQTEETKPEGTEDAASQGASDPASIGLGGHVAQFKDLIDAVRENRETFVNGPEARNALEVIIGVYQSARTGKPVHFPVAS
ncbi:MAG: Gfo/Idh/MocA family oxidoreductase [Armatimonadaceae bacterium]